MQVVPDACAGLLYVPRLRNVAFPKNVRFEDGAPYFNAGVQLIDLRRWREENIGKCAVSFSWKYGGQLLWRDQDALNCSLMGYWKALPPTWNFRELPHLLCQWETDALAIVNKRLNWGITVSPDGRALLYSQVDAEATDLMLVENSW